VNKRLLYIILTLCTAGAPFCADFGLVLGADGEYSGALSPEGFSAGITASPWFSAAPAENIGIYLSGKMTFSYEEGGEPPAAYFFELERTELKLRPAPGLYLSLGRRPFGDPGGLIASGLFDGLDGGINLGAGRISLGAYYTGLLYKERAEILMTPGDLERYKKPLDSGGLSGYFASRRALFALTGEFPDIRGRMGLSVQALAQFDLNGDAESLHTQYLELRFEAEPLDPLHLSFGGVGELAEGPEGAWGSAAVFAGADWELPGSPADLLSAGFLWTGGRISSGFRAFRPVNGGNAGRIFDGGTGALMRFTLSYRARPARSFSVEAGAGYFIRTDLETLTDAGLDGASGSRLLGGEVYAALVWAPDPAFRFSAGGGAFFPGWGGAYRSGTPVKWKANLGLLASL
jgi:hypothetical protein